jgi:Skp family chaperone for outer membrane proteins
VKTLVPFAATLAVVLTLTVETSQAQTQQAQSQNSWSANASKHGVAVIDISYIFKKHDRFKATMESMKKEMESTEADLKAERDKIAQKEEQRNTYNPGSAEYKQMDEQLARDMSEFNLKMTKIRKEFLEREAKVYYQTYTEISQAVSVYAQRHDIGLVIRFNGEPVDPNKRDDVLREINKPVVFQNQVDITPDVLAMLNSAAAGATAGGTATRPQGTAR